MARSHSDGEYGYGGANGMGVFGAVLAGAILGAAAMFFSDERNRNKVAKSFDHLREEGEDKVNDLKERGLEKVSGEISKAQDRIKREQKKT